MHSIIIHLRIKNCLSSSSRQTSSPRLLTRQEDGSTPCLLSLTLLFNKAPYKNVIVLGHVQDENGQKMSKSKGNAVDPFDALNRHTVQMRSAGISTSTVHHGFRTVSTARQL